MTLSISANNRTLIGYCAMTVFCMIFSAVYEYFSHGVYSPYMIGMFMIPFVIGVLPLLLIKKAGLADGGPLLRSLHMWAVITLAVGCCLTGVFQIYGSVSSYAGCYWIAGMLLLVAAGIGCLKKYFRRDLSGRERKKCPTDTYSKGMK